MRGIFERGFMVLSILAVLAGWLGVGLAAKAEAAPAKKCFISLSYFIGGGMRGGHYNIALRLENQREYRLNGAAPRLVITESFKEVYNDEEQKLTKELPPEVMDEVIAFMTRYNFRVWDTYPQTKYIARDAPTSEVHYAFWENGYRDFSVDNLQEREDPDKRVLLEVREFLRRYLYEGAAAMDDSKVRAVH